RSSSAVTNALRVGAIVVAVLAAAIGAMPIARGPGYEFSLLAGLIVPSVAAITSALERSKSETSLFHGALRGVTIGAALGGVALATALFWGLVFGFCSLVGGVVAYVLTAGIGSISGGL